MEMKFFDLDQNQSCDDYKRKMQMKLWVEKRKMRMKLWVEIYTQDKGNYRRDNADIAVNNFDKKFEEKE